MIASHPVTRIEKAAELLVERFKGFYYNQKEENSALSGIFTIAVLGV
jgi:cobalamin biosynthesis protein CobD/CbiB